MFGFILSKYYLKVLENYSNAGSDIDYPIGNIWLSAFEGNSILYPFLSIPLHFQWQICNQRSIKQRDVAVALEIALCTSSILRDVFISERLFADKDMIFIVIWSRCMYL